jgi:GNAT superfamily N-acetyltransferase
MNPANVVRLDEGLIDEAGAALGRAFFDDALAVHFLPDPNERSRLLPWHASTTVRYGHLFGEVWTTAERVYGAAVWWPPDAGAMTPERLERAGMDRAPEVLGAEAWARFTSVLEYLDPLHADAVPGRHWYLMLAGVEPARQRQGVGSALLAPVLGRADLERLPCYLETFEPPNVLFYQQVGFEVVVSDIEPRSGLRFWTMRRDPRS